MLIIQETAVFATINFNFVFYLKLLMKSNQAYYIGALLSFARLTQSEKYMHLIEQHVLYTNTVKQLPKTATDV
jgi:hypothetical protein